MTAQEIIRFGDGVRAEMQHIETVADGIVGLGEPKVDVDVAGLFRGELARAMSAWSSAVTLLAGLAVKERINATG